MFNDYEDYGYEVPREYWEEAINEIIKNVVEDKCKETIEQNEFISKELSNKREEIRMLNKEVRELKDNLVKFENFDVFLKMINKDNIVSIVDSFELPITNDDNYMYGMSSEHISPYLILIIKYYENRETILKLFKAVGIENIKSLEGFILPRDYSKELVKDILSNLSNRIISTNACYLGGNFGFWLGYLRDLSIDKLSKTVPLQEILKNKYITELYDNVINALKSGYNNKQLLGITQYQNLNREQILELSKCITMGGHNKLYDVERKFIKRHENILFNNDEFCEKYFQYADDNQYDTFAIHNFNKKYQIKYLKNISFNEAMGIINRIKCDDETKKEIIKAISI